ncbi:MAG TPA: MJ1255/VC2487 family glycosyltransferase [Polyangiales bacterium]|nr:MJ1255/VC2487 family glycosyltransferase [Polyangiales bacterium]
MKILYGVVGEGMGHAIRSRVVLEQLFAQGHQVEIMASSRAADFLAKRFPEVHRIHGLHIIYDENRVKKGRTLWSNLLQGTAALPEQIRSYYEMLEDFAPEVVISDFESWVYWYAKTHRLPIISIDNMQVLNRCTHDDAILDGIRTDFELSRAFVKSKLPFCDHYLVTTFFYPPIRKPDTTLVPPVLRREILDKPSRKGEHLVVYQTATSHDALADVLRSTGLECRIYGMRRDLTEDLVQGNLRYRPFDEATFIDDIASSRAVISGGSFTVMSECVYLHKPLLSVPVQGQIEQVVNGRYLQREGFGRTADHIDAPTVRAFLDALPGCEERLASYQQDGNRRLFDALNAQLDRAAAGL